MVFLNYGLSSCDRQPSYNVFILHDSLSKPKYVWILKKKHSEKVEIL